MDIQTAGNKLTEMEQRLFDYEKGWDNEYDKAVATAKKAMSYRTPRSPLNRNQFPYSVFKAGECPLCRNLVIKGERYCNCCGQALMWE